MDDGSQTNILSSSMQVKKKSHAKEKVLDMLISKNNFPGAVLFSKSIV